VTKWDIQPTTVFGLRGLDALTSNDKALVEMAYKFGGSAGMFGFERVRPLRFTVSTNVRQK
jgi:hypothetical protein